MLTNHYQVWPSGRPKALTVPATTLYDNLVVSARRYPQKVAIDYYGNQITYQTLLDACESLAGYLVEQLHVAKGDRIALYMQNSPQYVIAFHAVLRADAVVIPLNPMNMTDELKHYIQDGGAKVAIVGQELCGRMLPLLEDTCLTHIICAAYSDYLPENPDESLPAFIREPRVDFGDAAISWDRVMSASMKAPPSAAVSNDMAVMPYTSGTTGQPKGCMHPHRTVQANVIGAANWFLSNPEGASLTVLPLFHVTGMMQSMLLPIFSGSTMVMMTRWDRDMAAKLIERTKCTHWTNIATMVVDFLANPKIDDYDISSLTVVGGGGATLPKAVGERLFEKTGVRYCEGYGLSETISQTHVNPPDNAKLQCMGIPFFGVDARVINPETLEELGPNEEGEVIIHGPQVFDGYWNRPEDNEKSFLFRDGKRFFRTGDIARYDEQGYFFMVDRVKRMINASGFKVWPSEVESLLYRHPAIEQACVIGVPDERRGETVKAFVILRDNSKGSVTDEDIMAWSREQMAAYKVPRIVEIVDTLPVSGTGKILWRQLQEQEKQKLAANPS